MKGFFEQLDLVVLGNSLAQWILAAAAFLAVLMVLLVIRRIAEVKGPVWRKSGKTILELLALLLANTSRFVRVIFGLFIAEKILKLPPRVDAIFNVIIVVGVAVQVANWATTLLRYYVDRRAGVNSDEPPKPGAPVGVLIFVGQLLIWSLVALFALDNLGVNITALLAGLGVGGIAIALSVQTILGDLFASLSIAFDKPFVIGDTLRIDDIEGSVEQVGIKSTRLRSVNGEQIIVANADVLQNRVRNLGRMPERRIVQRLRIAYESRPGDVEQVPVIAEAVVRAQTEVRFVSCLLIELGVYALEFDLVYFVANGGPLMINRHVDAVNRGVFERFRAAGIRFAYPTERQLSASPAPK